MFRKVFKTFKFLPVLLTFTFCILTFTPPVHAQTNSTPAASVLPATIPAYVSPTTPLYTDLIVNNMFHTFSCLMAGVSVIGQPCLNYVNSIPVLSKVNVSGGALGATTSLIGLLYTNQPVRTADYIGSLGEQLGMVKTANAQVFGSGAQVLSPIFKLWKVSRNVSYLFMIIVFVIIGMMVLFRNRINPQTVITAQAALPGLVIGLILITFSYFLASLISDTAFIGTNLVGYYFSAAQGKPAQDLVAATSDQNTLTLFSQFIGVVGSGDATHALEIIFNNSGKAVQDFMRFAAGLMAFQYGNMAGHVVPVVGDLAGIIVGLGAGAVTAAAAPQIFGQVLAWISMVVLLYAMIKLLFRLINSFLTIIFLTITAPFQFLAAALPGRQGIATGWLLNMLANVLVFPAILGVFYFVAFLLGRTFGPLEISHLPQIQDGSLVPAVYAQGTSKIIGSAAFPLFGGLDTSFITIILALGALIASPAIPDIIVRTVGRVGQAGQLLGQELSGNIRGGQGYSQQGQQVGQVGSKIGQDFSHFRGSKLEYSPAEGTNIGKINLGEYAPFNRDGTATKGWRTWKPFGKKGAS